MSSFAAGGDAPRPNVDETRVELAVSIFRELIDWCHAQANSERGKAEPNQAALDRWAELVAQCRAEWESLDRGDEAAVDAVIASYLPIVRDFGPGQSGRLG